MLISVCILNLGAILGVGVASLAVREVSLNGVPTVDVLYGGDLEIACCPRLGVLGRIEDVIPVSE